MSFGLAVRPGAPSIRNVAHIAAARGVVAPHRYRQREITEAFARLVTHDSAHRVILERLHANAGVETRYLALPLERYPDLSGFGEANDVFIATALDLGAAAITGALDSCGLAPRDVDLLVSTSVTGIATPSIDARLVERIGLRCDLKRIPIFGLGCVAGASGIARVHDYLLGHPDDVAVLLSVELCSLTIQPDDDSMPNLVSSALFGDGGSAVVMVGAQRAERMGLTGPRVRASTSRIYPDSERVMGWDITGSGFRIVLSSSVAEIVEQYLAEDVEGFLEPFGLKAGDIETWVCHPGGPKVLDAVERSLALSPDALALSRRSLAAVGNLSSSSVLHVLAATLDREPQPAAESPGMLMAMGPGFCSELVLLEW